MSFFWPQLRNRAVESESANKKIEESESESANKKIEESESADLLADSAALVITLHNKISQFFSAYKIF